MWRPAATKVSGTNELPLGNKRRFGLPEEAPPSSSAPPSNYGRPPPQDIKFFNGRQERDDRGRYDDRPPRDDYDRGGDRRDDYRRDERDYGRDSRDGGRPRYDEPKQEERGRDQAPVDGKFRESDVRWIRFPHPSPEKAVTNVSDYLPPSSYLLIDPSPTPNKLTHYRLATYLTHASHALTDGPRKRRSRWGDANDRAAVPGMPVAVMGNVSQSELDNYAIHVRLEEINRKLRTGDVVPRDGQRQVQPFVLEWKQKLTSCFRSPSPPPQYDAYGRRANTREVRYRKKLEEERNKLVDRAMKSDPNFRPPADFAAQKRNSRPTDKVYIPVKEFPEINFFGLLVGPRGNSLKGMERASGAKISIRGKGSVKEGKGRPEAFAGDEEDELHCLITADDPAKVAACVKLINTVIETAASTPEGQNDHKRNQLRELASLNGTLRDDENQLCQNCGEKGHRKFECPQQRMYSANIICRICGGAGHMARDCRGRGDPNLAQNNQTQFDSEYSALMAELGEGGSGAPSAGGRPVGMITGGPPQPDQSRVPPWRIPENWNTNQRPQGFNMPHQGFSQAPTQNQGYGYGGYRPNEGYPGGAQGGYQQGPGQGQGGYGQDPPADPYAAYYASLGQQPPVATA
ncbi:splicing factor 1, partial [Tremellales sp. Uapishka_1]